MRKQDFCLCENKGADQLCSYCTADQHLCFRYTDNAFPPLLIPKLSRFYLCSVSAQNGLYQTRSETLKADFLTSRLIYENYQSFPFLRCIKYVGLPANCRLARDPANPCCQVPECSSFPYNVPTPAPTGYNSPTPAPQPKSECYYFAIRKLQSFYSGTKYSMVLLRIWPNHGYKMVNSL